MLQKFHFSLDSHEAELLCGSIAIVKEELFTGLDVPLGKNPDAMVPVHLQHLGVTIRIDGVVGKADLVALPRGINHKLIVQVEEERAHVLVVNFAAAISLVLGDDFPAVLRYEFVFGGSVSDEDAPSGDIRGRHEEALPETPLHRYISASNLGHVVLVRPTFRAQIRVTFTDS